MNQKPHNLPIILPILSFSTLALCTIIHSVCGQKLEGQRKKGIEHNSQRHLVCHLRRGRTRQEKINKISRVPTNQINHLMFKHNIMQLTAVAFSSLLLVCHQFTSCLCRSLCIRSHLYYRRFTHRRGVCLSLSTQYPSLAFHSQTPIQHLSIRFDVSIHTLTTNYTHDSLCFLPHPYQYSSPICCLLTITKHLDVDLLTEYVHFF